MGTHSSRYPQSIFESKNKKNIIFFYLNYNIIFTAFRKAKLHIPWACLCNELTAGFTLAIIPNTWSRLTLSDTPQFSNMATRASTFRITGSDFWVNIWGKTRHNAQLPETDLN